MVKHPDCIHYQILACLRAEVMPLLISQAATLREQCAQAASRPRNPAEGREPGAGVSAAYGPAAATHQLHQTASVGERGATAVAQRLGLPRESSPGVAPLTRPHG